MFASPEIKKLVRSRLLQMRKSDPHLFKKISTALSSQTEQFGRSPEELRTIERGARLYESGDPIRAISEILGYKCTPDIERSISLLESGSSKLIAYGCHSSGKTSFIGAGYVFLWRWFLSGCIVDSATNEPRGNLLSLVAGKEAQLFNTSWRAINSAASAAMRNGWKIPGYDDQKRHSYVSVTWRIDPVNWYIVPSTFKSPAKTSRSRILHDISGLKHPNGVIVWLEEAHTLPSQLYVAINGWNTSLQFGALNPYDSSGKAYQLITGKDFDSVSFSYLTHPNILNRDDEFIPGACSYLDLESEMRSPLNVIESDSDFPNPDFQEFKYALPSIGSENIPGPRQDGVPGHPLAEVKIFRPVSPVFVAGKMGQYPSSGDGSEVFSRRSIENSNELFSRLGISGNSQEMISSLGFPSVIGVDMAEGGPDRIYCCPRWGPSCFELIELYRVSMKETSGNHDISIENCLKCKKCMGSGCKYCFDGRMYIVISSPYEVSKIQVSSDQAKEISRKFGGKPKYIFDNAGGYRISHEVENGSCAAFGGSPHRQIDGIRKFANLRASMYGLLSIAMSLGFVALQFSPGVDESINIMTWAVKEDGDGEVSWKIMEKDEIKRLIGRSPDDADSFCLTEGITHGGWQGINESRR